VIETRLPSPPAEPFSFKNMWSKVSSTTANAKDAIQSTVEMHTTKANKPPHKSNNSRVESIRAKYSRLDGELP